MIYTPPTILPSSQQTLSYFITLNKFTDAFYPKDDFKLIDLKSTTRGTGCDDLIKDITVKNNFSCSVNYDKCCKVCILNPDQQTEGYVALLAKLAEMN